MRVTIRKAHPQDDAKAISKLIREELLQPVSASDTAKALTRLCMSTRHQIYVAAVDEVVVGFLHICDHDSVLLLQPQKAVMALAVASSYRRIGIGTALLKRAEHWAAESGAEGIRMDCCGGSGDAAAFCRACGYVDEQQEILFQKLFPRKTII